ncbi:MAG: DoxX family membrane protein [Bacteroidota bacterium]
MLFSTRIATIFIAVALVGWGIMHFMTGDFITGRAPSWPEGLPGRLAWAYTSGVLLIVSAISIVSGATFAPNQKTRFAVICSGILVLAWAGGRNLYAVLPNLDYGYMLTNLGKSITIGSGLLLIALDKKRSIFIFASICIGIFFLIGGIQHFIFIDFVKTLVPRWIPGDVFWSYVAGVGLVAAGIALITGIQRKLAALISSYMVFIWFLVLHVPLGFGETASFNEWIAIFEALFVASILAVIYWREER